MDNKDHFSAQHGAAELDEHRGTRADGAQSRQRLLITAMRLFAAQGFATTSTREIALAAGTNIAAISYYFGDKAGLYRATFREMSPCTPDAVSNFTDPALSLRAMLTQFYGMLLGQLKQGEDARVGMRLWFREMLEPTGLWRQEIDNDVRPAHNALALALSRHLGLDPGRDNVARLAYSIAGLALHMMVSREVIDVLSPQLMKDEAAIDIWLARLVDYAEALVNVERAAAVPPSLPRKKKS
ncbi:CerR family C-terminal domain-containing protein [Massilia sp. DWR3-1-1]|uniref:CerR family C-terminal domain-containing protein n=1 Tax=Massilia sp. DWR3-1-1 TaxID=2804559 RepID=UPI003CFA8FBC